MSVEGFNFIKDRIRYIYVCIYYIYIAEILLANHNTILYVAFRKVVNIFFINQKRIMYSAFLLLFLIQTDGLTLSNDQCTYMFKQSYPEDKNNYNVAEYNSFINYCSAEDVPNDINFGVRWAESGGGGLSDLLKIEFAPPKKQCKYGIALLINPSIKNERECEEYKFEEDDIKSKIHTIERNVCVFKNSDQFVRYNYNSTVATYKDIRIWFEYIFTGCYALRFHIGKQKYIIKDYKFLNTTYQRTEIMEPQFICQYDVNARSNFEKGHEVTNFTLNTSLPADTGSLLQVALISPLNKDLRKGCIWRKEPLLYEWKINLEVSTLKKTLTDQHCDVKLVQAVNGKYMKSIRCNFQLEMQAVNYCFLYHVIDDRCYKNTVWEPPCANNTIPCMWVKHCIPKTSENSLHVDNTSTINDKWLSANVLILPIIAIVLIVSAVIGILCFWHYLRIRKEEVNLYVNPQHDDSDCLKSTDFGIIDNVSEKRIDHDNPSCDDIILLYTNSSTSFMTLMKDFRETLTKMCSCPVHDWHDGAVWNEVAKVGAVSWFTELLNNGCRVVWMDTPATRSVVISNSRHNESSLDKLSKYYEIHDFRDMAFRVVLEVAKNKMNDVTRQYRRHFVVKFEGLESTANVNDPFLDLSPHARYCMPQHIVQLCSDLSVVKPEISKYKMKMEEDLYRIFVYQLYKSQTQQRLKFMKMESTI